MRALLSPALIDLHARRKYRPLIRWRYDKSTCQRPHRVMAARNHVW